MTFFLRTVFALALVQPAVSQTALEDPTFNRFTTADGLAQNYVTDVVQDDLGFLWVGTKGGLQRFDGASFEAYRSGNPETDELLGTRRTRPHLFDRRGRLWLTVGDGRLFRLQPASGTLTPIADAVHRSPVEDDSGSIWFANGAVNRVHLDADTARVVLEPSGRQELSRIQRAQRGGWWIGAVTDRSQVSLLHWNGADTVRYRLSDDFQSVVAIREDERNRVWVAGWTGLGFLDPSTGEFRQLPGLRSSSVRGFALLEGGLWLATPDWLGRMDAETLTLEHFTPDDGLETYLFNNIYQGRDGALWLPTLAHGLYRADLGRMPFRSYGGEAPESNAFVVALHEMFDGSLWVGTLGGGLRHVNREGQPVGRSDPSRAFAPSHGNSPSHENAPSHRNAPPHGHHAPEPRALQDDLHDDDVWSVHVDPDGRLWAGTGSGLCTLDPAGDGVRCFRHPDFQMGVESIIDDSEGRLWIGFSGGAALFDPAAERFVGQHFFESRPPAVRVLHRDHRGVVWAGTRSRGLYQYDAQSSTFTFAHLRDEVVNDIHEAEDGTLWIAYERGLAALSPDRASVERYTRGGTLPATSFFSVAEDDAGDLWLGTGHGLVRFNPATGAVRRFDGRDGIASVEFNRNAVLKRADGSLLFGGTDGITEVRPQHVTDETPTLQLTGVTKIGPEGVSERMLHGETELTLAPDEYALTLEWAALSYDRSGADRYRYRLDDVDPDWVEASDGRRVTYTGLQPGRYAFHIQASHSGSDWIEPGSGLSVTVRSAWWETLWFRLLAIGLLVGMVIAVHRWRIAHFLRVERMRLRIAADLHDSIGAGLSSIALISDTIRAGGRLDGRRRRQLERVSRSAREMVDDLRDIVWAVDPECEGFDNLVEKMRDEAGALLKGIRYKFDVPNEIPSLKLSMSMRRDLFLLYREALHNVVRHADARHVTIRLRVHGERLVLVVEDDGVGLQSSGGDGAALGTGMKSMRERAARLGGTLHVEPRPEGGTRLECETAVS